MSVLDDWLSKNYTQFVGFIWTRKIKIDKYQFPHNIRSYINVKDATQFLISIYFGVNKLLIHSLFSQWILQFKVERNIVGGILKQSSYIFLLYILVVRRKSAALVCSFGLPYLLNNHVNLPFSFPSFVSFSFCILF